MNTFLAFWSWDSINLNCFSYNGQILYPQSDSSGCIVTSQQNINASLDNAMQIFPNPANKWMTIKDQSFDTVTYGFISDLAGHRIKNFSITPTAPLVNIEDIQPGIYIITCETKKQIRRSNILIKE